MARYAVFLFILLSYTGVSVAKIGKAMLTPFHLFMGLLIGYAIFFASKKNNHIFISLFILTLYIVFVNVLAYPNIRYTSVIYTVIYAFECTILYNLLMRIKKEKVLYALKFIIISYAINLFFGFLFSMAHVDLVPGIINVHHGVPGESGRPMGFSSEPSYAAFMLSIAFMAFNHLRGHKLDKETMQLAGAYLASIVFMKSAYGFIFVTMNMLDWGLIVFKNLSDNVKGLFIVMALGVMMAVPLLMTNSENETIVRLNKVTQVLSDPTLDSKKKMKKLQEADGSAFARIGPTFLLISARDEIDVNLTVGAGAGAAGVFLADFLTGVIVDEGTEKVDTGIIPAFIFDYGVIGSILLIIFLINCFYNLPLPFWLCFILVLPNTNINTQLFWFAIVVYVYVSIYKARLLPEQVEAYRQQKLMLKNE